MAVWTDQPLGIDSTLNKIDIDYAAGELVVEYGLDELRYWKNFTVTVSTEQIDCSAVGIAQNAGGMGGSGKITEVSLDISEETTNPQEVAVNPGADVETGVRLMKVNDACLLFLGTRRKLTVGGQGVCPIPETAINSLLADYAPGVFAPAHGSFEIAVPDGALIGNLKTSSPKDDFRTWSVDTEIYSKNPSVGTSNIIDLPSAVAELLPADMVGVIQTSQKLSEGKTSNPTVAYSVTLYPTT